MKEVLVTGSSRGIGKAIALELGKAGFNVVVHCRNRINKAQETVSEIESIGSKASLLQFDISNREETIKEITSHIEKNGALYGVVLNAGVASDAPFPGLTAEDWDKVIHTNLDGFYNVLHPLVMPMIQKREGGRIVTLSSIAGITGHRGQVNYSASKAGIIGATKSLAQELAKRSITANCVAPGPIETEMTEGLPKEELLKHIPMRRFGTADEVAAVVGFLFNERASYITGQVISVNGGLA